MHDTLQSPPEAPTSSPLTRLDEIRARSAKLSSMSREELAQIGHRLYGNRGWHGRLARALGVQRPAVTKWSCGLNPVPQWATNAIRLLEAKQKTERALRRALSA